MIKDIIEGHINEVFGLNKDIVSERLDICKVCPLMKDTGLGMVCDNSRWLNKDTNEISYSPKKGFRRGCGCRLAAKATLKDMECPVGKW